MPKTKKQGFLFSFIMCICMCTIMSAYNMFLHNGFSSNTMLIWIKALLPTFLLAFAVSYLLVNPNVKKISFKLTKNNPKYKDNFMTLGMIIGMVTIMSAYGTIMSNGINSQFLTNYCTNFILSFIVALPLQLIFIKPIVKRIFNGILTLRSNLQALKHL